MYSHLEDSEPLAIELQRKIPILTSARQGPASALIGGFRNSPISVLKLVRY